MKLIENIKSKVSNTKETLLSKREQLIVENNKVIWVKVSDIHTDEYKDFLKLDKNRVQAIAESIRKDEYKVEHPVICVYKNHKYYLRDGHHRLAAMKVAKGESAKIPVIIKSFESAEQEAAYISDIELLSRHLTDYEFLVLLNRKYKAMEQSDQSRTKFIADMATLTGRSERSIYNGLDVLKLADETTKSKIESGELTLNAALILLKNSSSSKSKQKKTSSDKTEILLAKFCNFALRNLYLQYSIEEVETATTRILDAWNLNKANIDDEGYVIEPTKVNPASFSHLATKDESSSNPLDELIDTTDGEHPPRIIQYDVDDLE